MDCTTGIVADRRYINHDTGPCHPESPERIEALYTMLGEADMRDNYLRIEPRHAEMGELTFIHKRFHIDRVAATEGVACTALDCDTVASADSYEAA